MDNNPNALMLAQTNDIEMLKQKAAIYIASKFLPEAIKTPEQALAIIFYGRELNVPDWTALKHINVIHGKPQPDAQLSLALIQRSGLLEKFKIVQTDMKVCKLQVKRKGYAEMEIACTLDEAGQLRTTENGKNIALTEKYNWKQQPKTMLFYFTVKQMGHRLFNDVLNGMAGAREGDLSMPDIVDNAQFYDLELSEAGEAPAPPAPLSPSSSGANATSAGSAGSAEDITEGEFTETTEPPPVVEQPPAWADDPARLEAFYKRATERFSLTRQTQEETLDEFAGMGLGDWRREQDWALAALIAYACQYQPQRIDEYTSGMTDIAESIAFVLHAKARQIATARMDKAFEQI